jgi:hypothetical protein
MGVCAVREPCFAVPKPPFASAAGARAVHRVAQAPPEAKGRTHPQHSVVCAMRPKPLFQHQRLTVVCPAHAFVCATV